MKKRNKKLTKHTHPLSPFPHSPTQHTHATTTTTTTNYIQQKCQIVDAKIALSHKFVMLAVIVYIVLNLILGFGYMLQETPNAVVNAYVEEARCVGHPHSNRFNRLHSRRLSSRQEALNCVIRARSVRFGSC